MLLISLAGFACLGYAVSNLNYALIDLQFLVLLGFTIGFGSRITIQIPSFKSHISVSDTFVFLALLLYGGEIAICLAAAEAFFSSWRFCNKKITVFFNVAMTALSIAAVVFVLKLFGFYHEIRRVLK